MKLISLNVEGNIHLNKVLPFLEKEAPDVVCLMEATDKHVQYLQEHGYSTSFLPRCIREQQGEEFTEGLILASKSPIAFTSYRYYNPREEILKETFDEVLNRDTTPRTIIVGTVTYKNKEYAIATTHFTWTPNGDIACHAQKSDMEEFLKITQTLPPHILCGDFNIPRHHNSLYQTLASNYTDNIPKQYQTSLDGAFHKLKDIEIKKYLLEKYMVDYIFSKPPYRIEDVRLQFGVSDHAAVIATVLPLE